MEVVENVRNWVKVCINRSAGEIFSHIVNRIETDVTKTIHGLHEAKVQSAKGKGDKWEAFCYLYLQAIMPDAQVYFLKTVPDVVKKQLNLPGSDLGIDLVVIQPSGAIAVQCKYRHCTGKVSKFRPGGKTYITYANLATFIALCARTGPWIQHIVMTNCDGASWRKLKTVKDLTIAKTKFTKTPYSTWLSMSGIQGHSLNEKETLSNERRSQDHSLNEKETLSNERRLKLYLPLPTPQHVKLPLPEESKLPTQLTSQQLREYRANFYAKKS